MAIQAKDIMGKWEFTETFIESKSIPIEAQCFYDLGFGGSFTCTTIDNGVKVDIHVHGRWSFDENNAQMELVFKRDEDLGLPDRHYLCEVTNADNSTLKFSYKDVNGITSHAVLKAVVPT